MRVQFTATTAEKLDTVPKIDGQIVAVLDQLGYYYDYNGVRYQVNDGGSFVRFIQDLPEGTKVGSIDIDGQSTDLYAPTAPTKVSDLTNNVGFVTNLVSDLLNYYLKSETYSKSEVDALVATVTGISFKAVDSLPTTDIRTDVIYLVPKSSSTSQNAKDEYINTTGDSSGWELIGDTEVDLSDYVKSSELSTILQDYALIADVPTNTSDLINDSSFISDPNYVHTDNNFTNADKTKLQNASVVSVTQVATRGTEIAKITIDGVDTSIYASGGLLPRLNVWTDDGSEVSATNGVDTIAATQIGVGQYQIDLPDYGSWTVNSTLDSVSISTMMYIDTVKIYNVDLPHVAVPMVIGFPSGSTNKRLTSSNGMEEIVIADFETEFRYTADAVGTWKVTATYNGVAYTTDIEITASTTEANVFCPSPDDPDIAANTVSTWLMYGNVTGTYASLAAVLNDTTALAKLMADEFAVDYMLRSTNWMADIANSTNAINAIAASNIAAEKVLCNDIWNSYLYNKYPGITQPYLATLVGTHSPTMTSDTTPSGRVLYDSQVSGKPAYSMIYNLSGNPADRWQSDSTDTLHYAGYDFEISNILLTNFYFSWLSLNRSFTNKPVTIQGSVDGITWEDIEVVTPSTNSPGGSVGTQLTVDYCVPSKLKGYRAARVVFTSGPFLNGSNMASGFLLNVWGHIMN